MYRQLYCETSLAIKIGRADFIYISGDIIIGRLVSFSVVMTVIANNTITIYFSTRVRSNFTNTLQNITERLSPTNKKILETEINKIKRKVDTNKP